VSKFIEILIENSASAAEIESFERLETQFEEWSPSEAQLDLWLIKAFARISSIIRGQAAETSAAMFKKFGETIVNVPPILASPATVGSTWKMIDTAGYTITAGTKLNIASSGESVVAFEVVEDVTIAPGSKETTAGQVILRAVIPGTGGNGLSADPVPSDSNAATSAAETITLAGVTSGGVEEETEDAYLNRLTEELQLLSLSLIVPADFAKDARSVAGIARALALGGYNGETSGQPLYVTVFPTDASGAALSTPVKEALQVRQQAKVPSGVTVVVKDPKYTSIDVSAEVVSVTGYTPATVKAAVEARLAVYLSPASWGLPIFGDPSINPSGWENVKTVFINEVLAEIDRVPGVQRVVSAKIRKHSVGTLEAKDFALEGVVPLTELGTLTITAV
jgi:uncharacterized phage protein gp47/JayE